MLLHALFPNILAARFLTGSGYLRELSRTYCAHFEHWYIEQLGCQSGKMGLPLCFSRLANTSRENSSAAIQKPEIRSLAFRFSEELGRILGWLKGACVN